MDRLWLALFAWGGGLLVALLGWLDSKEFFDIRKFGASIIRALLPALVWAASYTLNGPLSWPVILAAIGSGPTFDSVVSKIAGALNGNGSWPLRKTKT